MPRAGKVKVVGTDGKKRGSSRDCRNQGAAIVSALPYPEILLSRPLPLLKHRQLFRPLRPIQSGSFFVSEQKTFERPNLMPVFFTPAVHRPPFSRAASTPPPSASAVHACNKFSAKYDCVRSRPLVVQYKRKLSMGEAPRRKNSKIILFFRALLKKKSRMGPTPASCGASHTNYYFGARVPSA